MGDSWVFTAIERYSKLILAWHLGKRSREDTLQFIIKLRRATEGRFQLSTDGWPSYPEAVERVFGADIDYAQLIKVYKASRDGEQRYSPAEVADDRCASRVQHFNVGALIPILIFHSGRVVYVQKDPRPGSGKEC